MSARDKATERQVQAADPRASTWLSANAGSGKTRVLTDRVARLLLDGVDPQNVLCLTYTKAAASEMQNRLFGRLGEWAMMEDTALERELALLGVPPSGGPGLARARRLFAQAIETPGGLRIQTIHSFCSAVLRRFPLEAGVSPDFTEIEERAAALLNGEVIDAMALDGEDGPLVSALAVEFGKDDIEPILATIAKNAEILGAEPDPDALRRALDLAGGETLDSLFAQTLLPGDEGDLTSLARLCADGSTTEQRTAARLEEFHRPMQGPFGRLAALETALLSGANAKEPFTPNPRIAVKATQEAHPDLFARIFALADRVAAARQTRLKLALFSRTLTLWQFAARFLPRLEAVKRARGVLDFDDLISRTRRLLSDSHMAAWVLFRLDGGIDHILVDEAQDTSPAQWELIRLLSEEFAAGEGARKDRPRTLFVVGDQKQSIYSFQGAEPEAFDRMRGHFEAALEAVGGVKSLALEHSFRSAEEVLRVVDMTFTGPALEGLGMELSHRAFKTELPGRVDLWPMIPAEKDEEPEHDWIRPLDEVRRTDPKAVLAAKLAAEIKRMLAEEFLPDRNGAVRRRVRAGDILILLRGRVSGLYDQIIRALKEEHLSVAGADRLRLSEELAVKDITAALRFLALPEDDLSLAAALRSPLFGWSEQALFTLAHHRPETATLWQALRDARDRHPETLAKLDDLRKQAEYLRPHDLISRLLIRHGGRQRLIARLGHEAEDGIDVLLGQALLYEQQEVPSLTGFLEWLEGDETEVKRQMDAQGDQIRVMTVHGAKGLEAPIVILPDTGVPSLRVRDEVYEAEGTPLWVGPKDTMPDVALDLREEMLAAQRRESRRLLYVAMTRAECWLIACGLDSGTSGESWHGMIASGLEAAGPADHVFPTGPGRRLERAGWNSLPVEGAEPPPAPVTARPVLEPLPEVSRQEVLTPTGLGGAKVLPGDTDPEAEEVSLAIGRAMHLLLEHLPDLPPEARADHARALLMAGEEMALLPDAEALIADALTLLDREDLAPVFAPSTLAEVPATATLPDGRRIAGLIDRLLIGPARVTAVDFKTNRLVPATAEQVPEGLLRQMGAYAHILGEIYPSHSIDTAILWTATGEMMHLPQNLVSAALARATTA